jgi:hypothetical protein
MGAKMAGKLTGCPQQTVISSPSLAVHYQVVTKRSGFTPRPKKADFSRHWTSSRFHMECRSSTGRPGRDQRAEEFEVFNVHQLALTPFLTFAGMANRTTEMPISYRILSA